DRNLGDDLGADVFGYFHDHLGLAVAGRHAVDGDALHRDFAGQRHREAVHAGLGRGIVGLAELAGLAVDRRDVDDAAECALGHAVDGVAAHVEHAVEVDVHQVAPLRRAHFLERGVAGDAGGVDHDIHASVFFGDVVDEVGAVFEVRDVGRGEHDAAVVFACFLAKCGEAFLTIAEIGGDDLTAIFRKLLANGGAQAADAASDD